MSNAGLHRLAAAAGVSLQWTDAFGQLQSVEDDSLRGLLGPMGLPAANPAQCHESFEQLEAATCGSQLPPLMTCWLGDPVRLPAGLLRNGARYVIELEQSQTISGALAEKNGMLETAPLQQAGYHPFRCGEVCITIAVAPRRCFGVADALQRAGLETHPKPWGLSAQLYSLKRQGDAGLGDFTALQSLVRSASDKGAHALAISPVHAMVSAAPERFSPYGPSSRLFFNVLHIDPAQVLGPEAYRPALAACVGSGELAHLEASSMVDWVQASQLRLKVLKRLNQQFRTDVRMQAPRQAFADFCREGGVDLYRHACFEALAFWLREHPQRQPGDAYGDWRNWPEPYRDPSRNEVARFAASHRNDIEFHQFLQWLAAQGLGSAQSAARASGMAIGIVADLAVGADPGGSQAWSLQKAMLSGLTVGAPPDLLATRGQNWGLGAFSPLALRDQGYAPWIAMLRANMKHSGGIRIDHVLGLKRLWLIPDGASADQGAYLHFPLEDLLRLITLESHRHGAIVIGEDLGTVPEGFSDHIADAGMLGIRTLWFQRHDTNFLPAREWPASAMATTSTHDLATLQGWWSGRDIEWRARLGLLGNAATAVEASEERQREKEALWSAVNPGMEKGDSLPSGAPVDKILEFVGSTPAALVIAPLEDVLDLAEQPNLPGTVDVHPNWKQRLPGDAGDLLEAPHVLRRLEELSRARSQSSGRHVDTVEGERP